MAPKRSPLSNKRTTTSERSSTVAQDSVVYHFPSTESTQEVKFQAQQSEKMQTHELMRKEQLSY